jgi:hypothetical protein
LPKRKSFSALIETFLLINLDEVKEKRFQLLGPRGEFWNRLERALDLSKNVSEPAKNDLGNSPSKSENLS